MIEAVTGFPGSGKSFYCTNRAYKNMKKGRLVFSNYPLNGAYKITFDDLVNYKFPTGSLVIIDEGGRWFNSRKWKDLPSEVFDLFTLHRHFELDLIVAVQNFNRIDIALREVIEIVWWAENSFVLPYFKYYQYYDVEQAGSLKDYQSVSRVWKWSRSRKLYNTHIMSDAIKDKGEIPLVPWVDGSEVKKVPIVQKMKKGLVNLMPKKIRKKIL